jgi:lipid-A-disaccharide synthase-like uncharacterized protein
VSDKIILIVGFLGQAIFGMRFVVQWICSERAHRSVIPEIFWYMSLGGSLLLLVYACMRKDIVFIVGQSSGFIIYIRNIYLLKKTSEKQDVRAGNEA